MPEKRPRAKTWKKSEDKLPDYKFLMKILKELGISSTKLHPFTVRKIIRDLNVEIGEWCVRNPEGFKMPYNMGYMAITKSIIIPFHEGKWEILDRVKNLSPERISERFRAKVIKKYNQKVTDVTLKTLLKRGKYINYLRYFNRKNCSISKGRIWMLRTENKVSNRVKGLDSSQYFAYHFEDFYDYKIKPFDK